MLNAVKMLLKSSVVSAAMTAALVTLLFVRTQAFKTDDLVVTNTSAFGGSATFNGSSGFGITSNTEMVTTVGDPIECDVPADASHEIRGPKIFPTGLGLTGGDNTGIEVVSNGSQLSFDTTAAGIAYAGIAVSANVSKSAGANALRVTGLAVAAEGGDQNVCMNCLAGDLIMTTGLINAGDVQATSTETGTLQTFGTAILAGPTTLEGRNVFQGTTGHIVDRGSIPVVSCPGTTATWSPAGLFSGELTAGAGATTCTITLNIAMTSPSCNVTAQNGVPPVYAITTPSNTAITISTPASLAGLIDVICIDHN